METVIEINDLQKRYRKREALLGVTLRIGRGEIFCLIGPDGAGKSSLMHILAGILRADGGSATLFGIDVLAHPEQVKPRIGLMAQGLGHTLSPELSVEENIDYFAAIRQVDSARRDSLKKRLLAATRLAPFAGRPAKNLSGGMKQKLALCCTLIHAPEILLLDEPTTGVDPVSRRDFYGVINEFVREDAITAVIATSYMEEAERGHRVALMHGGRVLACDTPERLKGGGAGVGALFDLEAEDQFHAAETLRRDGCCREIIPSGTSLILRAEADSAARIEGVLAQAGIGIRRLERTEPTMEYVFRRAIRKSAEEREVKPVHTLFEEYGHAAGDASNGAVMVSTDGLTKRFGSFTAVDAVSIEIRRGEIFGFLGPNGAGKTTLIKMLCGLLRPTAGAGAILDIPLGGDGRRIAEKIGYMSQKFSLYNDLRAIENIELFGGIYGLERSRLERRSRFALELSDLLGSERQRTKSLPLGMKQRLALACAILHRPELIFLDEPTSGVDPLARDRFWNIIYELSRRLGNTIIVTTHYMEEAERCDRLILMDDGAIQAIGAPDELRAEVAKVKGVPLSVATANPRAAYTKLKAGFDDVGYYGASTLVYSHEPGRDKPLIEAMLREAGIELYGIREREIPFDEVFIHYVEKGER
jgi:ABC-type multidrug transport system ATPase subunit